MYVWTAVNGRYVLTYSHGDPIAERNWQITARGLESPVTKLGRIPPPKPKPKKRRFTLVTRLLDL